ncbi:hypothetical protein [Lacticaseibacillus rhamnosus]|uniref:hypothetical protein n=1 Tax=Lacticaseibacillus rhamnosus TaxID=47715 RepID=UPI0035301F99
MDYLAKNGLLTNFKHTGNAQYLWKDFDQYQNKSDFFQEQTVRDHNLVTANGAAPLEFTKQVLKMIKFKNSEQIDKDIYLYEFAFYQFCKKVWQSILLFKLYRLSCLGGLTLKITCIFWVGKNLAWNMLFLKLLALIVLLRIQSVQTMMVLLVQQLK